MPPNEIESLLYISPFCDCMFVWVWYAFFWCFVSLFRAIYNSLSTFSFQLLWPLTFVLISMIIGSVAIIIAIMNINIVNDHHLLTSLPINTIIVISMSKIQKYPSLCFLIISLSLSLSSFPAASGLSLPLSLSYLSLSLYLSLTLSLTHSLFFFSLSLSPFLSCPLPLLSPPILSSLLPPSSSLFPSLSSLSLSSLSNRYTYLYLHVFTDLSIYQYI